MRKSIGLKSACVCKMTVLSLFTVLIFFVSLPSVVAAGKLEKIKNGISNGLIKVTAHETAISKMSFILCSIKNSDGLWNCLLKFRDNGNSKMSLHDEAHQEVSVNIKDGKCAELLFKMVDKKQAKRKSGKSVDGAGAWRKYKVSVFPNSYEIRIECTESSNSKYCAWYIIGNKGEYLMTETDIKDATDCAPGLTSIKVGDPAYAVIWGINSEFLYMLYWPGMKKVNAWRMNTNKSWYEFITNTDQQVSVFLHPTKKMITDEEIKKLCGKMLQNNRNKGTRK